MRTGTKFWLALGCVVLQVLMFVVLVATGKFTGDMVLPFLGGPVAVFSAFGILNVVASGQPVVTTVVTTTDKPGG
jgi:hypothetical protein